MDTLEALALEMMQNKQTDSLIAQNNPYLKGEGVADAITKGALSRVASDPTRYSKKDIFATTALSGLASGLFSAAGDSYQHSLKDRYNDVMQGTILGKQVDNGLPSNLFRSATDQGKLFLLKQKAATDARNSKIQDAMLEKYGGEIASQKGKIAALDAFGNNPDAQFLNPTHEKKFDMELKLSNDFKKEAGTYRYQEQGFKAMVEAFKDKAGTSDYELVRRAAQAVEPKLAVRKDDQDSIEQAASLFGGYREQVKSALTGGTKLTDDVRKGLMRIAARSLDSSAQEYKIARANAIERANSFGLDADRVVYQPEAKAYLDLAEGIDPSVFANQAGQEALANIDVSNPDIVAALQAQRAKLLAQQGQ